MLSSRLNDSTWRHHLIPYYVSNKGLIFVLMWYFTIVFSVKPDNVTLERNTTENNGCTDMWVNFTCNSSEANPPVHNYVLLRNETDVGLSEKGTWVEKISPGETFVYRCRAYQQVDNVSSTDNVTMTVNGKIKICSKQVITFSEHCIANRSEIVCFCFSL